MNTTIAVIGATGNQGGAVADALLRRGAQVRALVRNPQKAEGLAGRGAQLIKGDFTDPQVLRTLFEGVDAAFFMTVPQGDEVADGRAVVDAAKHAGVPRLVFDSVGGAERHTGIGHFETKRRVEEYITEQKAPATVVRPVYFMENLLHAVTVEDGEIVIRQPLAADVPLQMISARDIGEVAAEVLLGADVPGGAVEIAGDEKTGTEIARAFSEATGMPARWEEIPVDSVPMRDARDMFEWFTRLPAYRADFAETRRLAPGVMDLDTWLSSLDMEGVLQA